MPFTTQAPAPGPSSLTARLLDLARRRVSWLVLTAGSVALVTWLTLGQYFMRADGALLDMALDWVRPPAASNIVIVAIDDQSLETVGRWPWRRALHAELLRRISTGKPRCIGLDLLLDDANSIFPADDAMLAQSMKAAGCVVLPIAIQAPGNNEQLQSELLPTRPLADAATALGHSHLAINSEGDIQGAYIIEGFPGRMWPQFALALYQAANGKLRPQPSHAEGAHTSPPEGRWQRQHEELLIYNKPSARFQTVSYIDVLRGAVPEEFFRDRYVLVGPTAETVADMFALPSPDYLVPGVELAATMLQAFDRRQHVHAASMWQNLAFNLIPLLIVLLGLLWLGPVGVFALISAMVLVRSGLQLAQPWLGIRFTAAAGLGGLLLVYPVWSLMRLTAAYRFLQRGTVELNAVLAGLPVPNAQEQAGDFLDREIDASAAAVQRLRNLHRFVRDAIDHLHDANLVLNRSGRVFMANRAAARHWGRDAWQLAGQDAHELLSDLRARHDGQPMITQGSFGASHVVPISGEGEDAAGRVVLLRCVPFFNADNAYAGWMVTLVDLTEIRRTQAQRDEALRFISHDIREPSAAILTVVELARADPAMLPRDVLLKRIEQHARTGLALADGFVNLARAEAQPFKPEALDLLELAMQAVDNSWAGAQRKQVSVEFETGLEEAPFTGDRDLLSRALANLLSNALKFSPVRGRITCRVAQRPSHWTVAITDQGPGIAKELQSRLFQPFHRLHQDSHPEVHGVGLGLLLVRTTMQRHGGCVEIESEQGEGCTFILVLPKAAAATTLPGPANPTEEDA
ncbi:MAG: CHASE2 domain-containing protein [Proteobacteria bacterium]|nr:CHASE2 domain-containing protein [Pseudomonadota bacterium]